MTRTPGDHPLHVLLVEDNPGDARLVREAFAESDPDCSLTITTDGEAALDYLHQRADYDDVVRPASSSWT